MCKTLYVYIKLTDIWLSQNLLSKKLLADCTHMTTPKLELLIKRGRMAQLVARSLSMGKVSGSNPDSSKNYFFFQFYSSREERNLQFLQLAFI